MKNLKIYRLFTGKNNEFFQSHEGKGGGIRNFFNLSQDETAKFVDRSRENIMKFVYREIGGLDLLRNFIIWSNALYHQFYSSFDLRAKFL